MIEIQAKLVREQTAVYLAGEVVQCFVTFTNVQHKGKTFANDPCENLAWATVSIQCCCNSAGVHSSGISTTDVVSTTSLTRQNNLIVTTQPKFLFCDLRLEPGETKTYIFKEELPKTGPPTYRGARVKFFYKVLVATQRVGSKIQQLSVPIRVLPFCSLDDEALAILCDDTNEDVAPANPFIEKKKTETYLEILLHYLQNLTSRRCPNFYVITNKRGRVGRFCLFKSNYKLGEDIVGTLDFSTQTVKCVQYSVTLQSEEIVFMKSTNGVSETEKSFNYKTTVTTFNKHHEVCIGLFETQMILPIPLHVTPTFKTNEVEVKWRLHFQFVTSTNVNMESRTKPGECWNAPDDIEIETMVWNLPVQLLPTNPLQIPQPSRTHTLLIK